MRKTELSMFAAATLSLMGCTVPPDFPSQAELYDPKPDPRPSYPQKFALDIQRGRCCMKFVTVGRSVINANMIMSVEVYRAGNGCEMKVTGLDHPIKLSDQETEILLSLITPIGGMLAPL